jgi:hypothetical protein
MFFSNGYMFKRKETMFYRNSGLAWMVCMLISTQLQAQQLVTYPPPAGVVYSMHNDDFTVCVREPGKQWQDLFEYNVKVDMDKAQDASMVYFDMKGPVEVRVRVNNGELNRVRIRPAGKGIVPSIQGRLVRFTLRQPCKISLEVNGDTRHNLHLFANEPVQSKPSPADTGVIYFGPGVHLPPDTVHQAFHIPSGKTVYLDGSAILKGQLICDSVHNVRIMGRGLIAQGPEGIVLHRSRNITVDGVTFINPRHYTINGGASQNITIRNIKSFSCQGWSDGIDMMSCSNVVIDDVFMRNSDDCIAIYGHRWNHYGNARNYTITRAILWADVAHPINIGLHGNTATAGDTLENMLFKNIHILEQDEDDPAYQGAMAISCGDLNLVRHIRFENITVDDMEEGMLFNIRVVYNKKYNTAPGRGISDIYFRNISCNSSTMHSSLVSGFDKTHAVRGITFDHVRVNGRPVRRLHDIGCGTNPFATDIVFKN